ncbi:hypothetical protein, partial [Photorhabdus hainanensis]|uniref:hypothetical protein n=1 Tax=Photorhabdus hainanensis TaxID=1004166 RepID=UPI001BD5F5DE
LTGQCLTLLKRFQGFVEIERLSHLSFLFEIYYWNDTEFLTLPALHKISCRRAETINAWLIPTLPSWDNLMIIPFAFYFLTFLLSYFLTFLLLTSHYRTTFTWVLFSD